MYASTDKNIKLRKFQEETAVIYIRVSHPRQVTNYSIPTQLESCREYLNNRKIQEVGVFIEEGESAKTDDRHQLQSLLYFLSHNKGKVTYVLVYKIDRWARNQEDHFFIKTLLNKYKCRLISVSESIDETPLGKFIEGLFANLSQLDNDLKAERTRACLTTKALSGNYPGKAPYGYRNDPSIKTIQIDKKYFKHVQTCLVMFSNGGSIEDLLTYIKAKRIKTKSNSCKLIDHKVIKKILSKSMFYAGKYNWGINSNIQGTYEKMISWQQHLVIQDRLTNKKNTFVLTQQKVLSPFWLNFNYLPSNGFLSCHGCGARILSCFAKGKMGRKYPYYFCKNNQCKIQKKSIPKNNLEALFEKDLFNQLPSQVQLNGFSEFLLNQWEKEHGIIKTQARELSANIKSYKVKSLFLDLQQTKEVTTENLYNINSFISKDKLGKALINLKVSVNSINSTYSTANSQTKQRILKFIYPKGTLISQYKITNINENELFYLIKNFNKPVNLPDIFCSSVSEKIYELINTLETKNNL
jgi:DNA invertase Pin-like site-specific DNA recombinase